MSFSQAQLDALDAAIAVGALRVTQGGETVEYRSLDEMMRVRALMVASANPATGRQTHFQPAFERGT